MDWLIFALLTALFMGVAMILAKRVLSHEHSLEYSVLLSWLMLIVVLPILFFIDFQVTYLQLALILAEAIIVAIAFWLVAKTVRHAEVSETAAFVAMGPLFSFVLALIFLGETVTLEQFGGILLIVFGGFIINVNNGTHSLLDPFRYFFHKSYSKYIVGFTLLYAAASVLVRFTINQAGVITADPFSYFIVIHVFVAIILLNIFLFKRGNKLYKLKIMLKNEWMWFVLIIIATFGYRIFQTLALADPAGEVALVLSIKRLGLLIPILVGGGLFHEHGILKKSIAVIIMIAGALLLI